MPSTGCFACAGCFGLTAGATLIKKKTPRGRPGCDLKNQTKFIDGTDAWVDERDENGVTRRIHHGAMGILGLPLDNDRGLIKDKFGLVLQRRASERTTYDMIFGHEDFDNVKALARCTKQHTFKDALKPDGKPNPKPAIVDVPGTWDFLTYADVKREARAFGSALRRQYGIGQKEKVSIWSGNSVEWMLADIACAAFNFVSVSVYDTLGPDAASFIVADSGSQVLVCEPKTFKKVPAMLRDEIYTSNPGRDLKVVVCTGAADADTAQKLLNLGIQVASMHDLIRANSSNLVPDTPPKSATEDLVTIMYTSGTTGMPKGVMLTHRNVAATIGMVGVNPSIAITKDDVHLSYLPLAHIFERCNVMGLLRVGGLVYFASNGAKGLLADLGVVRPTLFAGVPKVYENVRDGVMRKMTGTKKKLLDAALKAKIADIETGCGYHPIWDKLIFSKTQQALGGRVRFCITGGAPISKDTLQFVMCALGPVVQGYGATETAAASTLTMSFDLETGHVGPAMGTSCLRLVDVPDMNYFTAPADAYKDPKFRDIFQAGKAKSGGEVWIGGTGVSPGYFDPSLNGLKMGIPSNGMAKKTAEDFFVQDGVAWFKTGDIGSWTNNGCLKIVDRRKNMFKTSLGEYVPVEEVEKTYQDQVAFADFVFLPKETKVAYVALCVVVSDSIGSVMKWAQENGIEGDEQAVCSSVQLKQHLHQQFTEAANEKKLQGFLKIPNAKNIHCEFQPLGYQEDWCAGVVCANGHREQLLTATFKARRAQLDQYFAPAFKNIYPDRPADHILP